MPELLLSQLCRVISAHGFPATLEGRDVHVRSVSTLEDAGEGELSFLSNPKYARQMETTRASAVIAAPGVPTPDGRSMVRCENPYAAVTVAIVAIHGHRRHPQWGVGDRAEIHPTAKLGAGANIAPGAAICAGAVLGDDCTLYPGAFVGERAQLGNGVVLFPNAVVYDDCELGDRVVIHAGSVIGEDGLGYAPVGDKWMKIPQVGKVVVEPDVEIGANCTIDRATLGTTRIGTGSKLSNLIAIGHGSKIGENAMIVALVGIAGSVTVGKNVTLAGQVGLAGHLTIGDGVSVGAQAGVSGDVEPGAKLLGSPAVDINVAKRQFIAIQRLPAWTRDVNRQIKDLQDQVAALQAALKSADGSRR
ncbi:MAG: UDP-3-O-(3-hydroxymyristoyl)glucosamine N-acyltransferase [Phycisphaerales bacterium]|nr:UDP-3-O-(3-hydroxymyristoyl)glucosamine N-acyltransferase [Phycisphaerales bacterium]